MSPKKLFEKVSFECLFLIVALIASYYYYKLSFLLTDGVGGWQFLTRVAENSESKPWQYRILIPYTANILYHLKLPILDSLERISKLLEVSCIFLLALSFRHYISLFIKDKAANSVLSLLIFLILPFNIFFPRPYHPYYWFDTPAVLFFTLGLIFMYQRKWILYYTVFVVATLNRETAGFLTMIYLFVSLGKEKKTKIIYHCTAQFVIWIMIKGVLVKLYANNPGPIFEWYDRPQITHFSDNLSFFSHIGNYPLFFSNMGFIWIPVLFCHRLIQNEFVKRSLWVAFPYFIGMMFVANIYELRIFAELIPVFLMAFILILNKLLQPRLATS